MAKYKILFIQGALRPSSISIVNIFSFYIVKQNQKAGRPREVELFILQRNAHIQYTYSIRRLKRAKSQILQDKFTQKLLNRGGDIFKEIKKFRGNSTTISNCIDGIGSNREMSSSLNLLLVRRLDGRWRRLEMRISVYRSGVSGMFRLNHSICPHVILQWNSLGSIVFSVHRCMQTAKLSPFISSAQGAGTGPLQKGLRSLSGVDIKPDQYQTH